MKIQRRNSCFSCIVISRCCFAETGKEMNMICNALAQPLFCLLVGVVLVTVVVSLSSLFFYMLDFRFLKPPGETKIGLKIAKFENSGQSPKGLKLYHSSVWRETTFGFKQKHIKLSAKIQWTMYTYFSRIQHFLDLATARTKQKRSEKRWAEKFRTDDVMQFLQFLWLAASYICAGNAHNWSPLRAKQSQTLC